MSQRIETNERPIPLDDYVDETWNGADITLQIEGKEIEEFLNTEPASDQRDINCDPELEELANELSSHSSLGIAPRGSLRDRQSLLPPPVDLNDPAYDAELDELANEASGIGQHEYCPPDSLKDPVLDAIVKAYLTED